MKKIRAIVGNVGRALVCAAAFGALLQVRAADGWKMFDRRVGLFVHWGIYAADGWHEQAQWRRGVPVAEYAKLMSKFTLRDYDPEKWIDLMEAAGMDYVVLTTKHHDGFCMWDTAETDYKVTRTPGGRDVLKELTDACRRRGIRVGLYYSCPDWHHPSAINFGGDHQLAHPNPGAAPDLVKYLDYVKRQVTELLTRYGRIDCFFWDIPPGVRMPEMNDFVRKLQPGIKINPRGFGPGDYETPERAEANDAEMLGANVPELKLKKRRAFEGPVEGCDSVDAESWGYRVNADYRSVAYCERAAAKLLSRGGNLLLNVGPDADGRIPGEAQSIVRRFGKWHKAVREAWKDVENDATLVSDEDCIVTRRKSGGRETVYLTYAKGLDRRGVNLFPLNRLPASAVLLNTGAPLQTEVVYMPSSFWEGGRRPSLHVSGIPVDDLAGEPVIIRLDYATPFAAAGVSGGTLPVINLTDVIRWGRPVPDGDWSYARRPGVSAICRDNCEHRVAIVYNTGDAPAKVTVTTYGESQTVTVAPSTVGVAAFNVQSLGSASPLLKPTPRDESKRERLRLRRLAKAEEEKALAGKTIDLALVGDSITDFWEDPEKGLPWFNKLREEFSVINLGFAGDGVQSLLWRLDNGELDGYRVKTIALMIGANNGQYGTEDTVAAIRAALARIRAKQPQAKIILQGILPAEYEPITCYRIKYRHVNAELAKLANGGDTAYLDFGDRLLDAEGHLTKEMAADGTHPETPGYEIWYKALRPLLD